MLEKSPPDVLRQELSARSAGLRRSELGSGFWDCRVLHGPPAHGRFSGRSRRPLTSSLPHPPEPLRPRPPAQPESTQTKTRPRNWSRPSLAKLTTNRKMQNVTTVSPAVPSPCPLCSAPRALPPLSSVLAPSGEQCDPRGCVMKAVTAHCRPHDHTRQRREAETGPQGGLVACGTHRRHQT